MSTVVDFRGWPGVPNLVEETKEPETVSMNCLLCGQFMAIVEVGYDGPKTHSNCWAMWFLETQVPLWPDTPENRAALERLKRNYPGLPWDASFHRKLPPPETYATTPHQAERGKVVLRCRAYRCPFVSVLQSLDEFPTSAMKHLESHPGHSFSFSQT